MTDERAPSPVPAPGGEQPPAAKLVARLAAARELALKADDESDIGTWTPSWSTDSDTDEHAIAPPSRRLVLPAAVPPEEMAAADEASPGARPRPAGPVAGAGAEADAPAASGADDPDGPTATASGGDEPGRPPGRGARSPMGTFGYVLMALLILSVPSLGYVGYRVLRTSTRGRVVSHDLKAGDPGYRALVNTTPTLLVVQTNADGTPASVALLALGGADAKGGSVMQIPLDTTLETPLQGITTIRDGYATGGLKGLGAAASQELGIGFDQVLSIDGPTLSRLVAPVAPLTVDNPSSVVGADGHRYASGKLQLTADEVGPFLGARPAGTDDTDHLERGAQVWRAWVQAIAAHGGSEAAVPGEASSGLGRFLRGLAAATSDSSVLPVVPVEGQGTYRADPVATRLAVTDAVPFPTSGTVGQRVLTRVLNGVEGATIPASVLQRLVYAGAQITEVGNYRQFGVTTTRIEYTDGRVKDTVDLMRKNLGAGTPTVVPDTGDTVVVTVIVGRDLTEHPPATLTAPGVGH